MPSLPLAREIMSTHEEMEILLESYVMDYNYLESKLEFLRNQLVSAEALVLLRLDTSRNQLLIADTNMSLITSCLAAGSFVGSLYGMNLVNHHENDPTLFQTVTIATVIGMLCIGTGVRTYFKVSDTLSVYFVRLIDVDREKVFYLL